MFNSRALKISLIIIVVFAMAGVANALAAANTVPATVGGEGNGVISGNVITDVQYHVTDTYPADITSVEFNITGTNPAVVQASLDSGSWVTCTTSLTPGKEFTCPVSGTLAGAASLQVSTGDITTP